MAMSDQYEIHSLDSDLRSIRLGDEPKLQPLRLEEMFTRATQWQGTAPAPGPILRPPSPKKQQDVYPLPKPMDGISPLGGLFDYPELVPLILKHFERPEEWVVLARVNRAFCGIVRKKLYNHVWIRPCVFFLPSTLNRGIPR